MDERTISERRVDLFHARQASSKILSSILTTIGAVEAISEGTAVQGLLTVAVGLALEKEQKDASRITCFLGLLLTLPAIINPAKNITNGTNAFLLALKASSVLMILRVLFMGRRLRQLGDLPKEKKA